MYNKVLPFILTLSLCFFSGCNPNSDDAAGGDDTQFPDPSIEQMKLLDADFIPFESYTLDMDTGVLEVPRADGSDGTVKFVMYPFGTHTFTGHLFGKAAADWKGLYVLSNEEMTDLGGGVYGIPKADIDAWTPWYVAVTDMTITMVVKNSDHKASYYSPYDYSFYVSARIDLPDGSCVQAFYDHLGILHPDFITKMTAAGNPSFETAADGNLIEHTFTVLKGEKLGQPQIQAEEVEGHTDYLSCYFAENGSHLPWMQTEFAFMYNSLYFSQYALVSDTENYRFKQTIIQGALNDNLNGTDTNYSFKDGTYLDWLWHNEFDLDREMYDFDECSGILSRMGDWWECPVEDGGIYYSPTYPITAGDTLNDDIFVVFPVDTDTALHDQSLLTNADVAYFAYKHNYADGDFAFYRGEVLEPSELDPLQGTMVIKWRTLDRTGLDPILYQGLAYYLNAETEILKIRWSAEYETEASVVLPVVPTDADIPDGVTLKSYDGQHRSRADLYGVN